jgi:hypothetical protein
MKKRTFKTLIKRRQISSISLLLVCIIIFNGCQQENLESPVDEIDTTTIELKDGITAPQHPQVVDNIPPEQEITIEEYNHNVGNLRKKNDQFSLNYTKSCNKYTFSACVPEGADIYDFYLFKDGIVYLFIGSTYGTFDNCINFTLYDLPNGSYTVAAFIHIWDYVNGGYLSWWTSTTPDVTINNNYNSWTPAGNGTKGWHIGDFNGDGKDDIFRYLLGNSGADMFLSTGSYFVPLGSWTGAVNGPDGWHIGDFNGDGKDDIFRYIQGISGANVFLSTGSNFVNSGSWTGAGYGTEGWHIGDFNGDGKDDIFRYVPGSSGADVFLSTGSSFVHSGSWTSNGNGTEGCI